MTRRVNEDATELSSIFQKMLLLGGCFKMEKTKMFTVYTNLLHMNFAFVLFCFSMGLPTNKTEIDDFAFNLGSCLALGTIVLKIVITRCKKYQSLIRDIFEYEEYMTNLAPKSLKKKYYSSANRQTPILRYYALTFVFNIVAAIFIAGFFILRYRPDSDHSRPIMIKIWLPLDPEKHYIAANFLCGLMVIVAGGLNITSDFTILYPVLNLIFRIKLLKHVLQHPEKFRGEYDDFRVMLQCVLEHENTIHRLLHLYFIFLLLCFFLGLLSYNKEIQYFAFDLGSCLCMCTTILKIGITKSCKYQNLVKEIFEYEDYMVKNAPDPLQKEYRRSAKKQTPILKNYALTLLFNIVASYIMAAFFILRYKSNSEQTRPIMIKVWIPLDAEEHYVVANLFYALMVTVVGGVNVTVDFMIIYPMVHLIFRIRMLKFVLRNPNKFLTGRPNYGFYDLMVECILDHQNIIEKHKNLNNMMTYFFFCDFLLRALQIAGFIFIIIRNIVSLNNLLYFGCVAFLLFQLFILYWYGQILIDESQSISNAIYMSNWYCENVKSQRLILMIMLRSQRPLGLKIGPIGVVHLGICLKILKTIYTIITMYSEV
ncbi:uncharacterized protein LOC123319744 isoform X2 [Coccinella septempunctata]|uniref:uncharacterized protein LOC123319744 isoform X2 n=1 Tax=Coccinella septempunctata TaxID=41139 RepID=UPI001D07374E|nr:uncharacterized protein LOC123319744 isoform X2 [Coccinella septempunctata]